MSNDPTDTQVLVRPEVTAFVDEVRRVLADLDEETRDELTGGLEADLADQVADGAPLGDPAAYAAELRSAAGLPERQRRFATLRHPGSVEAVLDASGARWRAFAAKPAVKPAWDVVAALRPAWWVLRAWVLVLAVDRVTGPWEAEGVVPSLGHPVVTVPVLACAVVLSTLVGTGRLWPGSGPDRRLLARLVLLVGNVAALVAVVAWTVDPGYSRLDQARDTSYSDGYRDGQRVLMRDPSLHVGDQQVRNIFAYDADGDPLPRVQLFDQDGHPIEIGPRASAEGRGAGRTVGCPSYNGDVAVYNVFPLELAEVPRGSCTTEDLAGAARPDHPLASVPRVFGLPYAEAEAVRVPPRDAGQGRGDRSR